MNINTLKDKLDESQERKKEIEKAFCKCLKNQKEVSVERMGEIMERMRNETK